MRGHVRGRSGRGRGDEEEGLFPGENSPQDSERAEVTLGDGERGCEEEEEGKEEPFPADHRPPLGVSLSVRTPPVPCPHVISEGYCEAAPAPQRSSCIPLLPPPQLTCQLLPPPRPQHEEER